MSPGPGITVYGIPNCDSVKEGRAWLTAQKLTSVGEPFFAYYDPPWTLIPFRRNEVLLRLATKS